jgi:hypothetical protein
MTATTVGTFAANKNDASQVSKMWISENTGVSDTNAKYAFDLYPANPIPVGGYIKMTIPSDIGVPTNFASGGLILTCFSSSSN